MKKIFIFVLLILCCSGLAFGGEFEDTLKKAEQGFAKAQFNLGLMYSKGEGVPQNYKQAMHWYSKAAEQGMAKAQYSLGLMYYIRQDYKLAYVWSSLAVAQGDESAIKYRGFAAEELTTQRLGEAQELAAQMQYKIDHR